MNKYLAGTLTVLFWISWPIYIVLYYIAITIFAILKVLYWPIAFVLQPVVYLLRFIAACLALPFRALVKLEVSKCSLNADICTMTRSNSTYTSLCTTTWELRHWWACSVDWHSSAHTTSSIASSGSIRWPSLLETAPSDNTAKRKLVTRHDPSRIFYRLALAMAWL